MTPPRPLVFLHVPKTAGQSVAAFLRAAFPERRFFSGTADHHLALCGRAELAGYDIFCGHFSWAYLDCLPRAPLFFTVLRDPVERVVSFYRYLVREAERLPAEVLALPQNAGVRLARELPFDDYVGEPDPSIRSVVLGTFDNCYMYYFATRSMQGRHLIRDFHHEHDAGTNERVLATAIANLERDVRVYDFRDLARLVSDFSREPGFVPAALPHLNGGGTIGDPVAAVSADPARTRSLLHVMCVYDMRICQHFFG